MSVWARVSALILSVAGAVGGAVVALAEWGVGYCGGLTPDVPPSGTLRSDLCRGTSGDAVGGVVVAAWLVAAGAPLLGRFFAERAGRSWPLVVATVVGAVPIVVVAILAETLPQS
jgi:hypothetical protein